MWGERRGAIHQNNMAAHSQCRRGVSQCNRLRSCGRIGHQSGRGQYPCAMQLENSAVHARSQTEVIGVDDKSAHRASLSILSPWMVLRCYHQCRPHW